MTRRTFLPIFAAGALLLLAPVGVRAAVAADGEPAKLEEVLEGLILKSSPLPPMEGFASYYAKRFEGRRTTSGHRYHPDKMTAAHESLPLGTVVRVVNPATHQEVHVTITDRCARKAFHFIDLSRAAAKKIGLWGKGRIKVVIIPLLQEKLEKPT
jgi:rare lipoprotein A